MKKFVLIAVFPAVLSFFTGCAQVEERKDVSVPAKEEIPTPAKEEIPTPAKEEIPVPVQRGLVSPSKEVAVPTYDEVIARSQKCISRVKTGESSKTPAYQRNAVIINAMYGDLKRSTESLTALKNMKDSLIGNSSQWTAQEEGVYTAARKNIWSLMNSIDGALGLTSP